MLGTFFYNESIRKIVTIFGNLFNNITIKRYTSDGITLQDSMKVPIFYGNKQKWLVRLQQDETLINKTQMSLPRMSFTYNNIRYDSDRKLNTLGKIHNVAASYGVRHVKIVDGGTGYSSAPSVAFSGGGGSGATGTAIISSGIVTGVTITNTGTGYTSSPTITFTGTNTTPASAVALLVDASFAYNPVPYDFDFELYVMVKNVDDGLQIIEQIVPFFTPDFVVPINELPALNVQRDIPIILERVSFEDTYDGKYEERRAIIYTLSFLVKGYIYGPVKTQGLIRDVIVNTYVDSEISGGSFKYEVTIDPPTANADDVFDFVETKTESPLTTS